jgi:hypothetical protein
MTIHIIRLSYQQAFFDTPTIGHFCVEAENAAAAVSDIQRCYRDYSIQVEFIATLPQLTQQASD